MLLNLRFEDCDHLTSFRCYIDIATLKCDFMLKRTLPDCGHQLEVLCEEWKVNSSRIKCQKACLKNFDCEENHDCKGVCGEYHRHEASLCPVEVDFVIDSCGHQASIKKKCGRPKPVTECEFTLRYKSETCGHLQTRKCCEDEKCLFRCNRKRQDCGHPCNLVCAANCLSETCPICRDEHEKAIELQLRAAKLSYRRVRKRARDVGPAVKLLSVRNSQKKEDLKNKCYQFFQHSELYQVGQFVAFHTVQCPMNSKEFWYAAAYKTNEIHQQELFRIIISPIDPGDNTNIDSLTVLIRNPSGTSFDFSKGAIDKDFPDNTSIHFSVIIGDLLVGDSVPDDSIKRNRKKYLRKNKKDSVLISKIGQPAKYRVYDRSKFHFRNIVEINLVPKAVVTTGSAEGETRYKLADYDKRNVSDPTVGSDSGNDNVRAQRDLKSRH